jgi:GT2 family glycosyltransferase
LSRFDLSIVIVNYNTRDLLRRCLESIRDHSDDLNVETIIVDNASKDGSADMVRQEFPELTLIDPGYNTWFTGGNNLGIQKAQGDYIMLLNPDTAVPPRLLETMIDYLKTHEEAGAITCRMVYPDGSVQYTCSQVPAYLDLLLGYTFLGALFVSWRDQRRKQMWYDGWQRDTTRAVEVIPGSCIMAARETMLAFNGYDERMKLYFCEDDLFKRLLATGKQTHFVADVTLLHEEHASTRQLQRLASQVYFDDLLVFSRKHYGVLSTLILQMLVVPTRIAMDFVQRLRGERKSI